MTEEEHSYCFEGEIEAFRYLNKKITHKRKITKFKGFNKWEIIDTLSHETDFSMQQLWHPHPDFVKNHKIKAFGQYESFLELQKVQGWYSSKYGKKEKVLEWIFSSQSKIITTTIEVMNK